MPGSDEKQQFLKSWWQWRNSLSESQRWMADAMAWSATHAADVQGYQWQQWSLEQIGSWIGEQNAEAWQQWGKNWKSESWAAGNQ
jgi:hypothetical protein